MSWSLGAGLEARTTIVTGAAGGIGRAISTALATAGARVCAVDQAGEPLTALVDSLPGPGPHMARRADVTDLAAHEELLQDAREALGSVYALVHTAAILRRAHSVATVSEADWDAQHTVNLKSTFFLCRAAAERMRTAGHGGRIVTFASQAWWTGSLGGGVVYAASKGGVVSLSRGLAREYARDGVTVNSVAPGIVDTPMFHRDLDPQTIDRMIADVPLGRLATPAEIASAALFLVSDHAGYITGTTLNVSGGMLMY